MEWETLAVPGRDKQEVRRSQKPRSPSSSASKTQPPAASKENLRPTEGTGADVGGGCTLEKEVMRPLAMTKGY